MSTQYPDINVRNGGHTFTIRTSFDAGSGYWETKILDLSGALTGKKLRTIQIGGKGVRNNTPETVELTRKNFTIIIRNYSPK